jgi:hypothetical protein
MALARPMPAAAAVTNARLPSSRPAIDFSSLWVDEIYRAARSPPIRCGGFGAPIAQYRLSGIVRRGSEESESTAMDISLRCV